MSAVELHRYSKTVSQVFSMLNLATYFFKNRRHQWNHRFTMTTCDTSLKILNTHQTTGKCCGWDFDTQVTRLFQHGCLYWKRQSPVRKSLATTDYHKTSTVNHRIMQSIVEVLWHVWIPLVEVARNGSRGKGIVSKWNGIPVSLTS